MSRRGLASRRESERLMQAGHVKVNGTIHRDPGHKIPSDSNIHIITGEAGGGDGLLLKPSVLLFKPAGIVSNQPDPNLKQVPAWKLLTERNYFVSNKEEEEERELLLQGILDQPWQMNVVGRLDKLSRGLLLMTQDGVLARKVIGTKNVTKRYVVRCDEAVEERQVKKLNAPMTLDGDRLLPMNVKLSASGDPFLLEFALREGKKHQIRRCCSKVGLEVTDLFRTEIGPFSVGGLKEGQWRMATEEEKCKLR